MKNSLLDDISSVVGFSATVRLSAHYGGRDLTVPLNISDKHPLAKLIGMSALNRLHAEWAGIRLAMPRLTIAEVEIRNAKILQKLLAGNSVENIAGETGLSNSRVRQLRKAFEADGILPQVLTARTHATEDDTSDDEEGCYDSASSSEAGPVAPLSAPAGPVAPLSASAGPAAILTDAMAGMMRQLTRD
jgi:hypothetical protein